MLEYHNKLSTPSLSKVRTGQTNGQTDATERITAAFPRGNKMRQSSFRQALIMAVWLNASAWSRSTKLLYAGRKNEANRFRK